MTRHSPTRSRCILKHGGAGVRVLNRHMSSIHFLILVVLVSTASPPNCGRCPCSWSYFEVTDACYKRFERPHSFDDAENRCRVFKGHLTSIHSYLENDFVERIAENGTFTGENDRLSWIGLKRNKGSKTWFWTDGSPYGYNKWAGQPETENKTQEKCAQMVSTFTKKKAIVFKALWHDADCNSNATFFICKKKA
ncbi:unnamed protein product [Cylicocyclus nassatus]|uniref:C-type lectin domain-containing protein n=1 Tax=Cylicocyclus nassatus TaxID=53992 RepID=A0AA36GZA6_CYLNA|nr:unnamed protein product [Cylicocyclus nassatus]